MSKGWDRLSPVKKKAGKKAVPSVRRGSRPASPSGSKSKAKVEAPNLEAIRIELFGAYQSLNAVERRLKLAHGTLSQVFTGKRPVSHRVMILIATWKGLSVTEVAGKFGRKL